jgi:hypothetical protein
MPDVADRKPFPNRRIIALTMEPPPVQYAKTGAANRTHAAVYARDRGIA